MIDAVREDVVDHRATAVALGNFIACVFEPTDIVEVRMVLIRDDRQSSVKSTWHMAADLAAQAASLIRRNQDGWNIYVGANPRRRWAAVKLPTCSWQDVSLPISTTTLPLPKAATDGSPAAYLIRHWRLNQVTAFIPIGDWLSLWRTFRAGVNSKGH